jgi:glycerophosphoryl diester phosphodiesterase
VPVADTAHYREFASADQLSSYLRAGSEAGPLVGAHRGGATARYPENAIPSFVNALRQGPVLLEVDVRMTRDSALVLMHDDTLGRTTTGTGAVQDHALSALRDLRLVADASTTPFRIPTAAEALAWAEGRAVLQLDVKEAVPRPLVLDLLRRTDGFDQALVITYETEDAVWYHERAPQLMLSVSADTPETARTLVDRIAPDRLVAFAGVGTTPDEVMQVFAEHDVRVTVGTFGDVDREARRRGLVVYHDLFNRGVGIVATDAEALASQAADTYTPAEN